LKIAHLTSVHPQNDNRIFYKECTTLADAGYHVTLLVAGGKEGYLNGVEIISYPKENRGRIYRMFKTSFIDMFRASKKIDADIYHFHDPELIFVGLLLKLQGKKVIYDIHENNPASILSKSYIKFAFLRRLISKIFDIFEKTAIYFFDGVVTARPDISKRFTHPNLITLRNFPILSSMENLSKPTLKKQKPSIIFVGNMTKIRGIYELLEAFSFLDMYELWLLGPITEKSLETKIKNASDNVRYLGVVEAYEIFGYIQMADIGIITFLAEPNHITTLATKPFEYMACGKPIVMSDFPYWKETFQESAEYVNPSNPKAIAEGIQNLLNDKARMQQMSTLNKRLSKEVYNWQKESKKLLDLYQKFVY